jgi:hypothetical protein
MRRLTLLLALLSLGLAPVPPPRPAPQGAVHDVYALLKRSGKVAFSGGQELKAERLEGRTLVNPILVRKDGWTFGAQEGEIEATRCRGSVLLTLRFGYARRADGYVSFYLSSSFELSLPRDR